MPIESLVVLGLTVSIFANKHRSRDSRIGSKKGDVNE
jgi:hypothetical protein